LQSSSNYFFDGEYAAVQVLSRFLSWFCHGFVHKQAGRAVWLFPANHRLSGFVFFRLDLVALPLLPKGRLLQVREDTIRLQSGMRLAICLAGHPMYN
jgi:hypothetical protein